MNVCGMKSDPKPDSSHKAIMEPGYINPTTILTPMGLSLLRKDSYKLPQIVSVRCTCIDGQSGLYSLRNQDPCLGRPRLGKRPLCQDFGTKSESYITETLDPSNIRLIVGRLDLQGYDIAPTLSQLKQIRCCVEEGCNLSDPVAPCSVAILRKVRDDLTTLESRLCAPKSAEMNT